MEKSALDRKLSEYRHRRAAEETLTVLRDTGVSVDAEDVIPLDELGPIWSRYIKRLNEAAPSAKRWPEDHVEAVSQHVRLLRDSIGRDRVLWFWLVESEPVAVAVRPDEVLTGAPPFLATRGHDLMISSRDATDGACLELNYEPDGDQYEFASWGRFAALPPA